MTTTYERITPRQYLVRERAAQFKSEYYDGDVRAMSGASREHNLLVANLVSLLTPRLRGGGCETYPSDMRVWVDHVRDYVYPDVVVACGEPEFQDDSFDTLLNPTLVFEVLSPSTAATDRGLKWDAYRKLASLRQYVLVAQDGYRVETYTRGPHGEWTFAIADGLEAELVLEAVGCALTLGDIYEGVPVWRAAAKRNAR